MPGLADIILASGLNDDDGLDDALQDPELDRQLAELRAKRDVLEARQAAGGGGPSTLPAGGGAGASGGGSDGQEGGYPRTSPSGRSEPSAGGAAAIGTQRQAAAPSQRAGRSLADAVAEQDVDGELEAMERELEQQLAEFRQQQRGSTAPTEEVSPDSASGGRTVEAATATAAAPATEIQTLMGEVALMEEAFPDAVADGDPSAPAPARRRPLPTRVEQSEPSPQEPGLLEMRTVLEDIESRLQSIHSRQVEHAPMPQYSSAPVAVSTEASRAIAEMQAQNKHLRECLQVEATKSRGSKGLWNVDRSLFAGKAQADSGG